MMCPLSIALENRQPRRGKSGRISPLVLQPTQLELGSPLFWTAAGWKIDAKVRIPTILHHLLPAGVSVRQALAPLAEPFEPHGLLAHISNVLRRRGRLPSI